MNERNGQRRKKTFSAFVSQREMVSSSSGTSSFLIIRFKGALVSPAAKLISPLESSRSSPALFDASHVTTSLLALLHRRSTCEAELEITADNVKNRES